MTTTQRVKASAPQAQVIQQGVESAKAYLGIDDIDLAHAEAIAAAMAVIIEDKRHPGSIDALAQAETRWGKSHRTADQVHVVTAQAAAYGLIQAAMQWRAAQGAL